MAITMTNLEKAKRDYPIGTQYKCVNNNTGMPPYYNNLTKLWTVYEYKEYYDKSIYSNNGWIFLNDHWAEIVNNNIIIEIW